MMKLTQKQLSALHNVLAFSHTHVKEDFGLIGEMHCDDGVILSDGGITLFYPESAGLEAASPESKDVAERLYSVFRKAWNSDFYRVEEPFTMQKVTSNIKKLCAQYKEEDDYMGRILLSTFHRTHFGDIDEYSAWFNVKYVAAAFEAVGKDAVGYLGTIKGLSRPYTALLVEPTNWFGDPLNGVHALILPKRA